MENTSQPAVAQAEFLGVGLHEIPAAAYHADPCPKPSLSRSIAELLNDWSPRHAYFAHPRLGGKREEKQSDSMDFGTVAHRLLLGRGEEFAVWDGKDWRGGDAATFWDEAVASNHVPIKRDDYNRARDMVSEVRRQLHSMGLGRFFSEGSMETVGIWEEEGQFHRVMFDNVIINEREGLIEINDAKTMGAPASVSKCSKHIGNMGYDLQERFYTRGGERLYPDFVGRVKFRFVFIESTFPFCVTPIELDGTGRGVGDSKVKRAMETWRNCMETNFWPGPATGIMTSNTPPWQVNNELEASGEINYE